MKTFSLSIIFSCFLHLLSGNNTILIALQKRKATIDQYVYKHQKEIIVLAKVTGKRNLISVKNEDWPDRTEYSYNILKDGSGRIIMIAQMPYSESGDWYVEYKHYFDDNGAVFAFSKRGTVFDDSVNGGVAVEESLIYYDDNFKMLTQTKRLTDKDNKIIKRNQNEFDFREFKYSIYKNVKDCIAGYNIQLH